MMVNPLLSKSSLLRVIYDLSRPGKEMDCKFLRWKLEMVNLLGIKWKIEKKEANALLDLVKISGFEREYLEKNGGGLASWRPSRVGQELNAADYEVISQFGYQICAIGGRGIYNDCVSNLELKYGPLRLNALDLRVLWPTCATSLFRRICSPTLTSSLWSY
ncbi:hypothetical protein SUGI_1199240 [Cryptomeria japonica]|nr:hypothetical protein SUGI_1199240 [Cryptomeria japonica]